MNLKTGLTFLSVTAALAALTLSGCLTTNQDVSADSRAANAQKLNFIQASTIPLAKAAVTGDPDTSAAATAQHLEAIGCPKLAQLFRDFSNYDGRGEFPRSFSANLACFGLSAAPTQEDVDSISKKFENPSELLNCVCGSDGLFKSIDYLKWSTFQANTSAAASFSFDGKSSTAGATYNGKSSSAAGSEFQGSSSSAGSSRFDK